MSPEGDENAAEYLQGSKVGSSWHVQFWSRTEGSWPAERKKKRKKKSELRAEKASASKEAPPISPLSLPTAPLLTSNNRLIETDPHPARRVRFVETEVRAEVPDAGEQRRLRLREAVGGRSDGRSDGRSEGGVGGAGGEGSEVGEG